MTTMIYRGVMYSLTAPAATRDRGPLTYRGVTCAATAPAATRDRPRLTYRGVDHHGLPRADPEAAVTVSLIYRGVAYRKSVAAPRFVEGL